MSAIKSTRESNLNESQDLSKKMDSKVNCLQVGKSGKVGQRKCCASQCTGLQLPVASRQLRGGDKRIKRGEKI